MYLSTQGVSFLDTPHDTDDEWVRNKTLGAEHLRVDGSVNTLIGVK